MSVQSGKKQRTLLFLALGCGIMLMLILITNLGLAIGTRSYIYNNIQDAPVAETALIPGAAVSASGTLSPIFKDRVDTAIQLYKAKKASKVLVSGDNSTVSYNEVNPVRNYLLLNGVLGRDIFLDHAGFDTYSTMYRARDIFRVTSVLIGTCERTSKKRPSRSGRSLYRTSSRSMFQRPATQYPSWGMPCASRRS